MRILIVEDERALARGMKFNFEQEGYQVDAVGDGPAALDLLDSADPPVDLVLLDLMLPGMSGYETCRHIRDRDTELPVLVLSARTLSEDKTQAFDCGTDQYMTKPFALPELLSRVRNLLERHQRHTPGPQPRAYTFGQVRVDFHSYQLDVDGTIYDLTRTEFELLRYFIDHEGNVLTRSELLRDVWGETDGITSRSIDNFVMRLRRKIEPVVSSPRHILSVRGTGYRFVAEPDTGKG